MISLLSAIAIGLILNMQAVSTWSIPRESETADLDTALIHHTIRSHMATAISTQTTITIQLPDTIMPLKTRSFSGLHLEAYADGSVSPGQIRVCGETSDWVITVSSLGRTRVTRERANC